MKKDSEKKVPKARKFSRREMIGFMGSTAAAAALAACGTGETGGRSNATSAGGAGTTSAGIEGGTTASATPSCVLTPEATEGPYYLEWLCTKSRSRTLEMVVWL